MKDRLLALFSFFLATAQMASAGYGAGNPRVAKLYATFLSPCCWRENLTVHNSEIAAKLRSEIVVMVQEGRSDDEIKSMFIEEFGRRILVLPEGPPRRWLFWTPLVAAAVGLIIFVLFVRRSRFSASASVYAAVPPAELEDTWDGT